VRNGLASSRSRTQDSVFEDTDRAVRVFVSSTFRDMAQERDTLAKQVFPSLRQLCEERGVVFTDVDLRWGVTDEEAAEGRVLPVCLEEIERSRPYFIGILGERYGWVPDAIPEALVESQPWLRAYEGRSITELEMLHGVLSNPDMADHSFFYFRDPAWVDRLPEERRPEFRDSSETSRLKLAELKRRIRESGLPLHDGFSDSAQLAELVLKDFTALLDRLFPAGSAPSVIERERRDHALFARERARHYLGRPEYFAALDVHVGADGPPLVVTGESGSGKSALLSAWLTGGGNAGGVPLDCRELVGRRAPLVFAHFVGVTSHSTSWEVICRRAVAEIVRATHVIIQIPVVASQMRAALQEALASAALTGPVVLVIDAVNQLEADGASLGWLPENLPEGVRLVISALPSPALDELRKRGCAELNVEPLAEAERTSLVTSYLGAFGKTLSAPRVSEIAESHSCENPLFLRTLLDELRLWGEHERLDDAIAEYLSARTIDDLFEKVLVRWERDYERDRRNLVGDTMRAVWASRHGLEEQELLDILGTPEGPLPQAYFSPLSTAAAGSLPLRAGRVTFGHDYLRKAAEERYLTTQDERFQAHTRLGTYFGSREASPRAAEELVYQLTCTSDWELLYRVLADIPFAAASWGASASDTRIAWQQIIASTDHTITEAYGSLLADPTTNYEFAATLSDMLSSLGLERESAALLEKLAEHASLSGRRLDTARLLKAQAARIFVRDVAKAEELLTRAERIYRWTFSPAAFFGLVECANTRGLIAIQRQDFATALHWLRVFGSASRLMRFDPYLETAYKNQALCFRALGDADAAWTADEEALRLSRQLGDNDRIAKSLVNTGDVLAKGGDFAGAIPRYEEAVQFYSALGDQTGLERALRQLKLAYSRSADADASRVTSVRQRLISLQDERIHIFEAAGDSEAASNRLVVRATELRRAGDRVAALDVIERALGLITESGLAGARGDALVTKAQLLVDVNRKGEAMECLVDAVPLLDDSARTRRAYANLLLGGLLRDAARDDDAQAAFTASADDYEEGKHFRDAGNALRLAGLLEEQRGRAQEASALYGRAAELFGDANQVAEQAKALRSQASQLNLNETRTQSLDAVQRAEALLRTIDEPWQLAEALYLEATICRDAGDLELAVLLLTESEDLFCRTDHPNDCGKAARRLAWTLGDLGRFDDALDAGVRAKSFAEKAVHAWGVAAATRIESMMLAHLERLDEAATEYERTIDLASDGKFAGELQGALKGLSRMLSSSGKAGEFPDAVTAVSRGLHTFREIGSDEDVGSVLVSYSDLLRKLDRSEEALQGYSEAVSLLGEGRRVKRAYANWHRGMLFRSGRRDSEALSAFAAGADDYAAGGCAKDAGDSLRLAGLSSERLNRDEEALGYYRRAEPLFREAGADFEEAQVLRFQGVLLRRSSADEALELLHRAEALFRTLDEPRQLAKTLFIAGGVLRRQRMYVAAIGALVEAADLFEADNSPRDRHMATQELALALKDADRVGESLAVAQRALAIAEEIPVQQGVASALKIEADELRALDRFVEAAELYRQAEAIMHQAGDRRGQYYALTGQFRALMSTGDTAGALVAAQEALATAEAVRWVLGAEAVRRLITTAAGGQS